MTTIRIEIQVDAELADDDHPTGLNSEGDEALGAAIGELGIITSGPTRVEP